MKYKIPFLYIFIHYSIGFLSVWYPQLFIYFSIYQLIQWVCDFRLFIFNKPIIKKGNSLYHTLDKFYQFSIGFFIGYILTIIR